MWIEESTIFAEGAIMLWTDEKSNIAKAWKVM